MTLKFDGWPSKTIGHLSKLYASFRHHMWIQIGVTVRKRLSWIVTSVTLTFDLWPWPFAWTSLLWLVITPENFRMMQWWEHSEKGVTVRQTDRQTDWPIHRAAWSQLKIFGKRHLQDYLMYFQTCLRRVMRRSGKKSSSFRASTIWHNQMMGATASLLSTHIEFVQGWR